MFTASIMEVATIMVADRAMLRAASLAVFRDSERRVKRVVQLTYSISWYTYGVTNKSLLSTMKRIFLKINEY